MKLCIVGAGHVGLITGACFADLGHDVVVVDVDRRRIAQLKRGAAPFYEPGLKELVRRNLREQRLAFTTDLAVGVRHALVIFICVGTPPKENGEADLSYVESVARQIARAMPGYRLIVEKSTVPVQTGTYVARTIDQARRKRVPFDVASNPEFLREGSAIHDFLHPDRIVIGVESKRARELLTELYGTFDAPLVITDINSSELIKHASNSFLAMKISYINAVASICRRVGADVVKVAEGMGLDPRIGRAFLDAGIGFGGFCFPKDIAAFIRIADQLGYDFALLKAVEQINHSAPSWFVASAKEALWVLSHKTIGVLGLAFKPNTDDMRFAPSLEVIRLLQAEGARVQVYDPQAMGEARPLLKRVTFCKDAYAVARGADALALVTEWNEFKELDFARIKRLMRQPVLLDGRNVYDPARMHELGFRYVGIGRGHLS